MKQDQRHLQHTNLMSYQKTYGNKYAVNGQSRATTPKFLKNLLHSTKYSDNKIKSRKKNHVLKRKKY